MSFVTLKKVSDTKRFQVGIRQFTYSEEGRALRIWINGRRFIARGGNWGFPESMLRYRAREYDAAVRYHKDMNFTMIRDWVGQTGDEAFYDACDKYGIVVWQDFWLANPVDGPNPDDNAMFLKNALDYILRIRNHASVGLWVGRNEGSPPEALNGALQKMTAELHPHSYYLPDSADGGVSGHGPYRTEFPKYYFQERASTKLHSEIGMPNVPTYDSVKQMMRPADLWPQGDVWGMHDFTITGAQGAAAWRDEIEKSYGGAKDAEEFVELSQFIDYNGYRAMFEAQGKNRMGVLLWMSHPCWPSMVWQTYDYYFDQSGGYFGSKKGAEPLHIQWNPVTDSVEVVNYSGGNATGLTAQAEILNMGEERGARFGRRQRADADQAGVSGGAFGGPLHKAEADARRADGLGEFLFAGHGREQFQSDSGFAEGGSDRGGEGGAAGLALDDDDRVAERLAAAGADGAGEGSAGEVGRPHSSGDPQRQLRGADAGRAAHDPHGGGGRRHARGATALGGGGI
jgi:hypothetical protein